MEPRVLRTSETLTVYTNLRRSEAISTTRHTSHARGRSLTRLTIFGECELHFCFVRGLHGSTSWRLPLAVCSMTGPGFGFRGNTNVECSLCRVWEQNVAVVVMTTGLMEGGRRKCHRYWPEKDSPELDAGTVAVSLVSEEDYDEWIKTTLTLTSGNATRTVIHMWYCPNTRLAKDSRSPSILGRCEHFHCLSGTLAGLIMVPPRPRHL